MWSYDDVFIFTAVIERGSFISAATKLNIPSSTVSRRVSQLESDLGIQLLERTSRKMHLTEKGKIFFEQCAPLINSLKENATELMASRDGIQGKLKVTAPIFLGSEILGDWFVDFLKNNKLIELELVLSNRHEDILDEEIDLAIRIGPLEDSKFIAQHLFTSSFVLCASPAYVGAFKKINSPHDISQHQTILSSHQKNEWEFRHLETSTIVQVKTHGRMCSNDISLTRRAAASGLGIAFLPRLSVAPMINSGELVSILDDYELLPKRDIYVVYPSKKYLSKKAQRLLNFIKEKSELLFTRTEQSKKIIRGT